MKLIWIQIPSLWICLWFCGKWGISTWIIGSRSESMKKLPSISVWNQGNKWGYSGNSAAIEALERCKVTEFRRG